MKTLEIELLALDLAVCDRCGGTLSNLKAALRAVRPALTALGIEAVLTETLVESEQQAERLRLVSSPTIRIAGHDITGTPRETICGACSELSGNEEGTECRVWPWRGSSHDEAPIGLIVEAIFRAISIEADTPEGPTKWSGVPANIRAFLGGKAKKAACCDTAAASCCDTASEPCCAPACCQ